MSTDARPLTPWLDLYELCEQGDRVAELLGAGPVPWGDTPPADARAYAEEVDAQNETLRRWAEADRIALEWWADEGLRREEEAARLHCSAAVDAFMTDALPARAGRRARAELVLALLSQGSCKPTLRHGVLVVDPPPELAAAALDLTPEICDLLDEAERGTT